MQHFSGLEEAVFRNINACRELAQSTRTALGPNGMNKMIINHIDKLFVTNDAATIIREIDVQVSSRHFHPYWCWMWMPVSRISICEQLINISHLTAARSVPGRWYMDDILHKTLSGLLRTTHANGPLAPHSTRRPRWSSSHHSSRSRRYEEGDLCERGRGRPLGEHMGAGR